MITVNPWGNCILIQFRADDDIGTSMEWDRLRRRATTFKGTALGTTGDGYDVVAAFSSEIDADQFMRALDRSGSYDYGGDIGAYIITVPVTIDI